MLNYYLNLPKEYDIDIETNKKVSFAVMKTAQESFEPFENYLKNAIEAMEKKEDITARWEKVKIENIAELKIIGKLYKVPKQFAIETKEGLDIKKGDVLRGSTKDHKIIDIQRNYIFCDSEIEDDETLFYNKKPIDFTIKKFDRPNGIIVKENSEEYILYSENNLPNYESIKQIASFVNFDNLCLENGKKLRAERSENLNLILENINDYEIIIYDGKIKFRLENIRRNNKEAWFIQLKEIENESQNDDVSALSPLRYFFDDDISVVDDKKNEYFIDFGIEDKYQIVLKNKEKKYCYPEGEIIKVKVNTYPIKKQKEAIQTLKKMPIDEHNKLIKLFNNREKTKWHEPIFTEDIEEWFVIKDEQRSGADKQRQFVKQALSTQDFAILEGPPGSGKTTVILELICQLAKRGERVLLCGSTHVAVDNILERLTEKREKNSLLDEFQILPIRIGDQTRINDDIKDFQIDNLVKKNNISENAKKLLLDSANLVCGTIIGILQHPKFKERNSWSSQQGKNINNSWLEPIIPEFDYLIIDESSKTTFQEFLVPALYAKKWILVGDCLQLAPFTERNEIVSNIEKLFDKDLQNAVFYLHKLKYLLKNKNNKFILPVSEGEIVKIQEELEKGRKKYFNGRQYFITKKNRKIDTIEAVAYDIIFIDKDILSQILPKLPETHAVLRYPNWEGTQHAFTHNAFCEHNKFTYEDIRHKKYADSFEIVEYMNEYFQEKKWAEEIAWRIDREHQLRLVEKKEQKEKYTEFIDEELIPRSLDKEEIENKINMVAFMAFPSVLESLTKGINVRKVKFESTISEGFKEQDLESRKTILNYQHRMHPEISEFPRNTFYKGEALLDLEKPISIEKSREWKFNKYVTRNIWVDILGKEEKSKNIKEVESLMEHLKSFVAWAKENEQPEGKEWSIACLTFYRGQEKIIREKLQNFTGKTNGISNFDIKDGKYKINIKLHTVDKFQGHEADIVFLSMVQTKRIGFMDNPNRLNVAITRAKFQLVVFGDNKYFSEIQLSSDELKELSKSMEVHK